MCGKTLQHTVLLRRKQEKNTSRLKIKQLEEGRESRKGSRMTFIFIVHEPDHALLCFYLHFKANAGPTPSNWIDFPLEECC